MWWFTLVFGMFGLHHFYLRSPQTGLIFLIANFMSLGYLWAHDLVQLSSSGGYTTETLNRHGLAHPWGAMGLAQGMWKEASIFPELTPAAKDDPPNPLWFLLYALAIPCAPLAQLIAGDTNNAVSRFADLTVVPLGFMFYLFAMLYDYWVLFSNPADLLVAGSKRFFPFTYLGMDADGHSPLLTGVSEIKPCPPDNFITTMFRVGKPLLAVLAPGAVKAIDSALQTKQEVEATVETTKKIVIDGALAKAEKASQLATQIGSLSTLPPAGMIPSTDGITQFTNPVTGQGLGTMVGGARLESQRLQSQSKNLFNTLDYAALGSLGAVIGGGLLLSANRFRNVFSQGNDSPPDPRAVRNDVY